MAGRTLLEELEQDEELSLAAAIVQNARPGTRCYELRNRLTGRHGREVTLLVPVNRAITKAAEARRTTIELFCKTPEVADLIAGHAVLDRWPLAALRMLGTSLDSLRGSTMQLLFMPSGDGRVSVRVAESGERPTRLSAGDISCRNGLLHKIGRLLTPSRQAWRSAASQQEALERSVAAKHEMMKDRMELNRKTRPGPPLPGPISKALEARRTVSAHDRQRAQAFAPLYGDDYEPRLYTGNKPLPPRRDSSAHRTAPKVTQDRIHAEQEPTLEHVWEEWEPLKKEEVRLRSELKEYQDYLQSKESVIAEHASLVREVLPPSGLSWAVRPNKVLDLALLRDDHQRLLSSLCRHDPQLVESEVVVAGRVIPAHSRLCQEVLPWTSKQWIRVELPDVPCDAFPLWSVPFDNRGIESRLQHLEAHLMAEQLGLQLAPMQGESSKLEQLYSDNEKGISLAELFNWFDKHGVRWGLHEQRGFLRLCEALGVLEAPERAGPARLQTRSQETEDIPELIQRRIQRKMVSTVLNLPKLPEEHADLQALLGHLRHMAGTTGNPAQGLKQEVSAQSAWLAALKGRLHVLESGLPSPWSPPVDLWQDLIGAQPPSTTPEALLDIVSTALAEARRKAVQRAEAAAVATEAVKASADGKFRQVAWLEAQAAAKEAEAELLEQHLQEQAERLKEYEVERRRGQNGASMLGVLEAEEAAHRASAIALQQHARKVQRAWRSRQRQGRLKLGAVLFLQFRVRRWRKKRQMAAKKIQVRWSTFTRVKRGLEGVVKQGAACMSRLQKSAAR
ncbi:unnamed protein product [Effrenium voratum]|uniref:FAS1 domain-containing protein n=1 Tax=Effrenium voratum TaxID=2562239 RepID=A0AA36I982_9DINO|nr:unnamed protein product [Effrenium voratum]